MNDDKKEAKLLIEAKSAGGDAVEMNIKLLGNKEFLENSMAVAIQSSKELRIFLEIAMAKSKDESITDEVRIVNKK